MRSTIDARIVSNVGGLVGYNKGEIGIQKGTAGNYSKDRAAAVLDSSINAGQNAGAIVGHTNKSLISGVKDNKHYVFVYNATVECEDIASISKAGIAIGAVDVTSESVKIDQIFVVNSLVKASGTNVGGLIGYVNADKISQGKNVLITNITLRSIKISATTHNAGGVVGSIFVGQDPINNSTTAVVQLSNININEINIENTNGRNIGGVIGSANGVLVQDVEIKNDITSARGNSIVSNYKSDVADAGSNIGGVIGLAVNSSINGAKISNLTINAFTGSVGGLVGYYAYNTATKGFFSTSTLFVTGETNQISLNDITISITSSSVDDNKKYSDNGRVGGLLGAEASQYSGKDAVKLFSGSKEVTLNNIKLSGGSFVGGIAGITYHEIARGQTKTTNPGTGSTAEAQADLAVVITNISISSSGSYVGGAVGYTNRSIYGVRIIADPTSSNTIVSAGHYVGGIAGLVSTTKVIGATDPAVAEGTKALYNKEGVEIKAVEVSKISVSSTSFATQSYVGGIVGWTSAYVGSGYIKGTEKGNVTSLDKVQVTETLLNTVVVSNATVRANGAYVGGVVGSTIAPINRVIVTSEASGEYNNITSTNGNHVGGVVGKTINNIFNSVVQNVQISAKSVGEAGVNFDKFNPDTYPEANVGGVAGSTTAKLYNVMLTTVAGAAVQSNNIITASDNFNKNIGGIVGKLYNGDENNKTNLGNNYDNYLNNCSVYNTEIKANNSQTSYIGGIVGGYVVKTLESVRYNLEAKQVARRESAINYFSGEKDGDIVYKLLDSSTKKYNSINSQSIYNVEVEGYDYVGGIIGAVTGSNNREYVYDTLTYEIINPVNLSNINITNINVTGANEFVGGVIGKLSVKKQVGRVDNDYVDLSAQEGHFIMTCTKQNLQVLFNSSAQNDLISSDINSLYDGIGSSISKIEVKSTSLQRSTINASGCIAYVGGIAGYVDTIIETANKQYVNNTITEVAIKDDHQIIIENMDITSSAQCTGGVAGYAVNVAANWIAPIDNKYTTSGNEHRTGLIGINSINITSSQQRVGGVVGDAKFVNGNYVLVGSEITSTSTKEVTYIGGLFGKINGTFMKDFSDNEHRGDGNKYVYVKRLKFNISNGSNYITASTYGIGGAIGALRINNNIIMSEQAVKVEQLTMNVSACHVGGVIGHLRGYGENDVVVSGAAYLYNSEIIATGLSQYVGGLIGLVDHDNPNHKTHLVNLLINIITIEVTGSNGHYVGGCIGMTTGDIETAALSDYGYGLKLSSNGRFIGGIVGRCDGTITDTKLNSAVTINSTFAGRYTVVDGGSNAVGNIFVYDAYVGGIAGYANKFGTAPATTDLVNFSAGAQPIRKDNLTFSYQSSNPLETTWRADVVVTNNLTITALQGVVGGIVGYVKEFYSTVFMESVIDIETSGQSVGGVVGYLEDKMENIYVNRFFEEEGKDYKKEYEPAISIKGNNQENTHIYGDQYVGGVVGGGTALKYYDGTTARYLSEPVVYNEGNYTEYKLAPYDNNSFNASLTAMNMEAVAELLYPERIEIDGGFYHDYTKLNEKLFITPDGKNYLDKIKDNDPNTYDHLQINFYAYDKYDNIIRNASYSMQLQIPDDNDDKEKIKEIRNNNTKQMMQYNECLTVGIPGKESWLSLGAKYIIAKIEFVTNEVIPKTTATLQFSFGDTYKYDYNHLSNMFLSLSERMQDKIKAKVTFLNKDATKTSKIYNGSQYIELMKLIKEIRNKGNNLYSDIRFDSVIVYNVKIGKINFQPKTGSEPDQQQRAKNDKYFIAVDNLTISATQYAGGVTGYSVNDYIFVNDPGHVSNIDITVNNNYAGGIAGYYQSSGNITGIAKYINITGRDYLGGYVGSNQGSAEVAFTADNLKYININGNNFLGGAIGRNTGEVHGSTMQVTIVGNNYVGGIAGFSIEDITADVSDSKISGNTFVGGIVGQTYADFMLGRYTSADGYMAHIDHVEVSGYSYVGGIAGSVNKRYDYRPNPTGEIGKNLKLGWAYVSNSSSVTGGYNVGGLFGEVIADNIVGRDGNYGEAVDNNTCFAGVYDSIVRADNASNTYNFGVYAMSYYEEGEYANNGPQNNDNYSCVGGIFGYVCTTLGDQILKNHSEEAKKRGCGGILLNRIEVINVMVEGLSGVGGVAGVLEGVYQPGITYVMGDRTGTYLINGNSCVGGVIGAQLDAVRIKEDEAQIIKAVFSGNSNVIDYKIGNMGATNVGGAIGLFGSMKTAIVKNIQSAFIGKDGYVRGEASINSAITYNVYKNSKDPNVGADSTASYSYIGSPEGNNTIINISNGVHKTQLPLIAGDKGYGAAASAVNDTYYYFDSHTLTDKIFFVQGNSEAGGLVGRISGLIEGTNAEGDNAVSISDARTKSAVKMANCKIGTINVNVIANGNAGGWFGSVSYAQISLASKESGAKSDGKLTISEGFYNTVVQSTGDNIGGLVGYLEGSLLSNAENGDPLIIFPKINANSGDNIGGAVGMAHNASIMGIQIGLSKSDESGRVFIHGGKNNIGGIVGRVDITDSSYKKIGNKNEERTFVVGCSVVSTKVVGEECVGGIVGYGVGVVISSCVSGGGVNTTGPVSVSDTTIEGITYVGGIIGYHKFRNNAKDEYDVNDYNPDSTIGSGNRIMIFGVTNNADVSGEKYIGGVAGYIDRAGVIFKNEGLGESDVGGVKYINTSYDSNNIDESETISLGSGSSAKCNPDATIRWKKPFTAKSIKDINNSYNKEDDASTSGVVQYSSFDEAKLHFVQEQNVEQTWDELAGSNGAFQSDISDMLFTHRPDLSSGSTSKSVSQTITVNYKVSAGSTTKKYPPSEAIFIGDIVGNRYLDNMNPKGTSITIGDKRYYNYNNNHADNVVDDNDLTWNDVLIGDQIELTTNKYKEGTVDIDVSMTMQWVRTDCYIDIDTELNRKNTLSGYTHTQSLRDWTVENVEDWGTDNWKDVNEIAYVFKDNKYYICEQSKDTTINIYALEIKFEMMCDSGVSGMDGEYSRTLRLYNMLTYKLIHDPGGLSKMERIEIYSFGAFPPKTVGLSYINNTQKIQSFKYNIPHTVLDVDGKGNLPVKVVNQTAFTEKNILGKFKPILGGGLGGTIDQSQFPIDETSDITNSTTGSLFTSGFTYNYSVWWEDTDSSNINLATYLGAHTAQDQEKAPSTAGGSTSGTTKLGNSSDLTKNATTHANVRSNITNLGGNYLMCLGALQMCDIETTTPAYTEDIKGNKRTPKYGNGNPSAPSEGKAVRYNYNTHYFAQAGTDQANYLPGEHKNSEGDLVFNNVTYNFNDVIALLKSGKQIYLDCFGFVRLVQLLANEGKYNNIISSYSSITHTVGVGRGSTDAVKPGAILRWDYPSGKNKHVAIYLYTEGTTGYYIDQDCNVKSGTWTTFSENGSQRYMIPYTGAGKMYYVNM